MQKYKDVEKEIVTQRECVFAQCDMCKREAEYPKSVEFQQGFEWGSVGVSGGSIQSSRITDGEHDSKELDLCYECAELLIDQINHGKVKR